MITPVMIIALAFEADGARLTHDDARTLVRNAPDVLIHRLAEKCLRFETSDFETGDDTPVVMISVYNTCSRGQGSGKIALSFVDRRTGTVMSVAPVPENVVDSPRLKALREKLLRARQR